MKEVRPKIIAELAQGFEGNKEQAMLLLHAAKSAGASAAKFQLVYSDELATIDYVHYELFKKLEMSESEWADLASYARSIDLDLYLDVFGEKSLNLALDIGAKGIKIHGTDINNASLLQKVNKSKVDLVFIGIGGALIGEIEKALSLVCEKKIILLHGFQGYPTRTESNQLERMHYLINKLSKTHSGVEIGFSDHSQSTQSSIALSCIALGLGIKIFEKHLTLGLVMKLEDYESALNPDQFAKYVRVLGESYSAIGPVLGNYDLGMPIQELDYRNAIRRHVVASKELEVGHVINEDDVVLKRTSYKNPITALEMVYGRTVNCLVKKNQALFPENLNIDIVSHEKT